MIRNLKELQALIGVTVDGVWEPKSTSALREYLKSNTVQITKNISLNELLASNTAKSKGIDNTPNGVVLNNLIEAAHYLWQPVRDILGHPIRITSGYRSPKLNSAVGGAANSAHKFGNAIDFQCPGFGTTRQIITKLQAEFRKHGVKFDQLILEYPNSSGSWVHLGYRHMNGAQRKQMFRIG